MGKERAIVLCATLVILFVLVFAGFVFAFIFTFPTWLSVRYLFAALFSGFMAMCFVHSRKEIENKIKKENENV